MRQVAQAQLMLSGLAVIGASVHFIPLHRHPYWRDTYGLETRDYPVAERHFPHVVSLPLSSGLTDAQAEHVVATVRSLLAPGAEDA